MTPTPHTRQAVDAKEVPGVVAMVPFADPRVLALYGRYERSVYEAIKVA